MSFKDKVVIVTGASSGIGAAAAVMFSREGARVVMVGRNERKLGAVAGRCAAVGPAPHVVRADVSVDDDARRIIDDTVSKFGKLDVLVNNAGVLAYGSILDGRVLEAHDKIMNINFRSVVCLTALAAPHLVETKGNIVNVSSVAGQMVSYPIFNAYNASKAALDHFSRGAAQELATVGVRVNVVSPGPVYTDIIENSGSNEFDVFGYKTPLGRISQPEEIADLILYLASDRAKGITGSVFVMDNGTLVGNKTK